MARSRKKVKPLFSNVELLAIPRTEGARQEITSKGERAVRENYTTLRDIALKRLKRAQARGYMTGREPFAKLADITSAQDLAIEYANVSKFLLSPESTAKGREAREEKVVKKLNKRGLDFVNKKNVADFGKFMGVMREIYSDKMPDGAKQLYLDSDTLADYYDAMRESTREKVRNIYGERETLGKENGKDRADLDPAVKKSRDSIKKAFEKWKRKRR